MDYASRFNFEYRSEVQKVIPSPTLNLSAKSICKKIENNVRDDGEVLIAGCGDDGGEGISGFTKKFISNNIVGLDIRETEFTDVVGDINNMPFDDERFSAVICQATLEHIEDMSTALREIERVVKTEGYVYIDVPFMQGYHALPTDFRRLTSIGLDNAISKETELKVIKKGVSKGPTSTLVWIICEYTAYLLSMGNFKAKKMLSLTVRFMLFWVKYVDVILKKTHGIDESAMSIPSAVFWYGKKCSEK